MPQQTPDVVVAGGGVIGLGIAWRAAAAGLRVTVCDPAPGHGASWVAAGLLTPVTEIRYGEERLLELAMASARAYPDFVAELEERTGLPAGYRACGTLVVARDADDNAVLGDLYDYQRQVGVHAQRLRGREARQLEPRLAPRTRGAILTGSDHQVDNRALVTALLRACELEGVELRAAEVAAVTVRDGRAAGVELAGGDRLGAGQVVLAAGCRSGQVGGLPPEVVPPVRPVKGQLLHLRGAPEDPLVSHNLWGLEAYLVPRADGRVVVGATVEERGFDTTVTAGAVHELLRAAIELVPDVAELELTETIAGLRPGSPDNAPILGASELPGLVVATGHYRQGILLTPATATAVAELLQTGTDPESIAPFTPRRFSAAAAAAPAPHLVR